MSFKSFYEKNKYLKSYEEVLKNSFYVDIAAATATLLFIIAGLLVSLIRFWQYNTFYYNFGVFDEAIYHVSRFQPPIIEHLLVGGKWSLADHFDLSVLLLAPLFWITSRSEVLLVAQAIFAGLAGFIIYKIGVNVLKDKFISFAIACCYFLFVGIQNAVITDFQELTVMTITVALTFLFIIKRRLKLFWLFFLVTLGFKEVTFALGIGISIFILFYNRNWLKHAIIAIIISALWGYLAIHYFIPFFSGGIYLHEPPLPPGIIDKITAMVDVPIKRQTLYYSFLQFGFLPLFAPSMWMVILQDYALRFLSVAHDTYWSLGLHYNAVVSVLLSIASIFGFAFIQKLKIIFKLRYIIAILLILNAFYIFRFVLHGPFLLATNSAFYAQTSDFKYLDILIAKIPQNASVMTQNNLGVRFDHQKFIFLRLNYEPYKPDYILIDNRPGQNPNDFLFGPDPDKFIATVKLDKNYKLIYHTKYQFIFKRI